MQTGMTQAKSEVMQEVPVSRRKIFERAFTGKSRNMAIKAFCLRCVGYAAKDVRECTAYKCPLHQYRPYQSSDAEELESDYTEPAPP